MIHPFCKSKYDNKNRGWVHKDIDTWFGGIVYLTKDPEPDTGTSVYHVKQGYSYQTQQEMQMKEKLYRDEEIDIEEYNKAWDKMKEQYVETVSVKNVYNRFVLFGGKSHHGVITFGTKERTTLNFFGTGMTGHLPPLLRTR